MTSPKPTSELATIPAELIATCTGGAERWPGAELNMTGGWHPFRLLPNSIVGGVGWHNRAATSPTSPTS